MNILEEIEQDFSLLRAPKVRAKQRIKSVKDLHLNRWLVIYPAEQLGGGWDYQLTSYRTKPEAQEFVRYFIKELPQFHEKALEPIIIDSLNQGR